VVKAPLSGGIRRYAAAALLAAALSSTTMPVLAHAVLLKADPPRRAAVVKPPSEARLWFNEPLEPAYVSASVRNAAGSVLTDEPARLASDNPKQLKLPLPPLVPGKYTLQYRVLSIDGHVVDSNYYFTVTGAPKAK